MQTVTTDLKNLLEYVDLSARVDASTKTLKVLAYSMLGVSDISERKYNIGTVDYELTLFLAALIERIGYYKEELEKFELPSAEDIINGCDDIHLDFDLVGD